MFLMFYVVHTIHEFTITFHSLSRTLPACFHMFATKVGLPKTSLVGRCQRAHQAPGNFVFCFWWGMLTFFGLAHLRDATVMHVLLHLHTVVMLCWQDLLLHLHTVVMLRWQDLLLHLHTVVMLRWQATNMYGDVISKLVRHWSCWKSWPSWWKTTTPTTAEKVKKW